MSQPWDTPRMQEHMAANGADWSLPSVEEANTAADRAYENDPATDWQLADAATMPPAQVRSGWEARMAQGAARSKAAERRAAMVRHPSGTQLPTTQTMRQ